jgi:poly [ADP-ribose] polymerase
MSSDEDQSETDRESVRSESVKSEKQIELKPDKRIYNSTQYKVYKDYSCRLERQDEERNRNKFYLIQILVKNNLYYVYSRWGRKGQGGQQRMSSPFDDPNEAIRNFEKRFKDKTGLDWNMRDHLSDYQGMYKIYNDDLSLQTLKQNQEEEQQQKISQKGSQKGSEELPESAKDWRSKQLEQEQDPLEKSAIILKDICYEINVLKSDKTNDIVKSLSNELFNICPDAFGKKKPSLDSNDGIKQALTMLLEYKSQMESQEQEE